MMDIVRQSSLSYGSGSAWDACGQHYLPHAVHSSTLPDRHTAQAHTELWLDDDSPSMAMLEIISERIHAAWNNRRDVRELCQFVQTVVPELECCYATVISALVYMQKLEAKFKGSRIDTSAVSCQQLYMVCLIIASKFVSDMPFTNQQWAEVAGLTLTHVNELERSALSALDWYLAVDVKDYDDEKRNLEQLANLRMGFAAQQQSLLAKRKASASFDTPNLPRPAPALLKQTYSEDALRLDSARSVTLGMTDLDLYTMSSAPTPQCFLGTTTPAEVGAAAPSSSAGESSVMLYPAPQEYHLPRVADPHPHHHHHHHHHQNHTHNNIPHHGGGVHNNGHGGHAHLAAPLAAKIESCKPAALQHCTVQSHHHHSHQQQQARQASGAAPGALPHTVRYPYAQQHQDQHFKPQPQQQQPHKPATAASASTWADYVACKLGYSRLFGSGGGGAGGNGGTSSSYTHSSSSKIMTPMSCDPLGSSSSVWKQQQQQPERPPSAGLPLHCLPPLPVVSGSQGCARTSQAEAELTLSHGMGTVYLPIQHPSKGPHTTHQLPSGYTQLEPALPLARPMAPKAALVQESYSRSALYYGAL